jgi:hypothetical protein
MYLCVLLMNKSQLTIFKIFKNPTVITFLLNFKGIYYDIYRFKLDLSIYYHYYIYLFLFVYMYDNI